jgi:transposase InsO family protein
MASSPKKYSSDFKVKVVLEAVKGQKTLNEISSEYGVHTTQITQWKKQVLDELPQIYPQPRLSLAGVPSVRYPYLLRGVSIERINQVWSCDITYIRLARGFVYLVAIIDWFSRFVLAWELSTTLDTSFCLEALDRALRAAQPEIFNTVKARSVYQQRFYRSFASITDSYQLGWSRAGTGQHFRRAFMAECEIRGSLSQRLSNSFRSVRWINTVFPVLQL